ncbi:hypothetical protein KDA_33800 [Dictyobacter alpinus]|uniref:Uncharacterized protein n=1 Tax=Dictyobacter alpinus TaxID=2014873 RepID=A0A402B982_9CHLR|nr:hypothetical protein [Dictyobacter alpinus]GCE27896.1 hypothetical protein KDA_33800 [Dictyobacter alpinus]
MNSPVKVLGAFLDTLYLNVYQTDSSYQVVKKKLSDELKAELQLLKDEAQEEEENIPTRFVFDGQPLLMMMKGGEGFNWILKNESINLCVNRSSKMNLCAQVRCSSEYLWKLRDIGLIVNNVFCFLTHVFGDFICLQVSALDLAVDTVNFHLPCADDIKERFISRAQLSKERPGCLDDGFVDGPEEINRRWGRITGLPFGARGAAISALIYDKTHEIKYKSRAKSWFFDLWSESARVQGFEYSEDMQVMRTEMRFRRPALREMKQSVTTVEDGVEHEEVLFHGIEDAFMLESYIAGLWGYAVGHVDGGADGLPDGWLRYVIPSDTDVNRSRWDVHPDWQVIQTAFAVPAVEESDYEAEEKEREDLLSEVDAYLEEHPMDTSKTPVKKRKQSALKQPSYVVPLVNPLLFNLAPYIRKRKRQVNMDRMVAQLTGCLSTFEAWRAHSDDKLPADVEADFSDTLSVYYRLAEEYMQQRKKDYSKIVRKKRVLYHIAESVA